MDVTNCLIFGVLFNYLIQGLIVIWISILILISDLILLTLDIIRNLDFKLFSEFSWLHITW